MKRLLGFWPLLTLIFALAFFLRIYRVADTPHDLYVDEVAIGWNAYSILKTGRDEYGTRLPLFFRSYDDYKLPVYIYATTLSEAILGKTAFAVNLALNIAKQNIPVGIFSMEMSVDQVVDRLIAADSGVSLWKMRTGKLSHHEEHNDFLRITTACEELSEIPVFIDDSPSPNILQMRAMARRLQSEYGLGLLIIDYLQLMASNRRYDSPVQQVTEISRGLKGLAKELNIPIIALSQLSRAIEQREGNKPRLSDLRDSGSIEQDADLVMFIHRDDKTNYANAERDGKLNVAQLLVAKHRNGPTGEIEFRINPDSLRFQEIDRSHQTEII